jgi:hypothetical protein
MFQTVATFETSPGGTASNLRVALSYIKKLFTTSFFDNASLAYFHRQLTTAYLYAYFSEIQGVMKKFYF